MARPFEDVRPALSPTALVRVRGDGSAGVYDPTSGAGLEVAPDQARLLVLLDGQRTVAGVMEEHWARHKAMPLAALDDLLSKLAATGALAGTAPSGPRGPWLSRYLSPRTLWRGAVPGLAILALLLSAAAPALAFLGLTPSPLSARDVVLALLGAAWAHSLRRWYQAAVLPALGAPVGHLEVGHTGGVPWVGPDVGGLFLLDRPRRALAHLAGLAGLALATLIAATLSKGLAFGAAAVAVVELCPFVPSLAGRLLATLAGKVDLQEHARAYVDRRLLKRVAAKGTFDGEVSLVWTSLLSLAWLGWVVRLLFTRGAVTVLRLLAIAVEEEGPSRLVLFAGAGVLALLLPLSLVALFGAVARAFLALRPPPAAHLGTATQGAGAQVDLSTVPLFARLPAAERDAVLAAGQRLDFPDGAMLVAQGTRGDRFYALLSGQVGVHVNESSGLTKKVAVLRAGDCFGETALLAEGRRTATIKAEGPVTVLALGKDAFARLQGELRGSQLSSLLRNSAALKRSTFFGALPADRLSSLALRLAPKSVQAGQVLIRRGEAGGECFLVSSGRFEVLGDGDAPVATLGPGDHFGEVALLRDVPRTATVRAAEAGEVLSLSRAEFLDAVTRDLGLSRSLERLAADRAGGAR